jgi:hypothetical protein
MEIKDQSNKAYNSTLTDRLVLVVRDASDSLYAQWQSAMAPGTPSPCSTHTLCGSSAGRRSGIPLPPGGQRGPGLCPPVQHQDQGGELA